ncbi:MAG: TonB-dependent receptor [Chitinophagales bacterium]|nr:TonB-dependent receptor [Chitinophagales bacterium]
MNYFFGYGKVIFSVYISHLMRHSFTGIFITACLCGFLALPAQKITVSGYVTDAETGEQLIGAVVYDKLSQAGTTTNHYGFYSITLSADSALLTASYVGYKPAQVTVAKSGTVNFRLSLLNDLKEVEIKATRSSIERESQMSTVVIPVTQIKEIPALLGEVDVIKVIQLLPGVQKGTEGTSGMYVRGGGPDQNLILLDGVPVYNVNHLFGFFSVFNGDAINSVQLIKGGFPAYYGGRLSSVIDITMKEGDLNSYNLEGGIGLLASRLTAEGPIKKNKGSFIISGRRTYLDLLMRPILRRISGGQANLGYYFYDLNTKLNWRFSDKDRLYLSAYLGRDVFGGKTTDKYEDEYEKNTSGIRFGLNWGNITTALRWNLVVSPKIFHNLTATYSQYRFRVGANYYGKRIDKINPDNSTEVESGIRYISGIDDVALRSDFDFTPVPSHYIKFGANAIFHTFSPGATTYDSRYNNISFDTAIGSGKIYAGEFAAYIQDDWEITPRWKTNLGMHASAFTVQRKFYGSVQPRLSTRVMIMPQMSVKGSFCLMTQYLHLLTNSGVGLPTDLWLPVTAKIKPQWAYQGALGWAYTLKELYEFSVEGYYKRMWNVIDYKNGANFINSSDNWEDNLTQGRGWSYGTEFLVQRKEGKLTGWVGYTLSWTLRQFNDRNYGRPFFYKYDRRHDLSVVAVYRINQNWRVSGTFIYATGNALTLPTEKYNVANDLQGDISGFFGLYVENFDRVNNYRVPDYHRLDLGVNYSPDLDFKGLKLDFNLSVYNVYSRLNPFFVYLGYSDKDPGKPVLKKVALFPIIPSLTINFKWGFEPAPRKNKYNKTTETSSPENQINE